MNNIKSERVRIGLTQESLGDSLNVDPSTIRRWETNGSDVPSGMAIKMSSLFGCSNALEANVATVRSMAENADEAADAAKSAADECF